MSSGLDLGPYLDQAKVYYEDAVRSAGTTVSITQPVPGAMINPDTLELAEPDPILIKDETPAIVVQDAPGGEERIYPGTSTAQAPRWKISLLLEITDILRGYVITVLSSRDPRLIGRRFEVNVPVDGTAGVARQVIADAIPDGGQS